MGSSWITQFWLACTQVSILTQLLNFAFAPWLRTSTVLVSLSRLCLWVIMECFLVWFTLRASWYHTVPLASLYESFCVLIIFICSLNIKAQSSKGSGRWLSLGITIALSGILLFIDSALPLNMQQSDGPPQSLRAPWLLIHVSMMIISYACLTAGSLLVLGGIYAMRYITVSQFSRMRR